MKYKKLVIGDKEYTENKRINELLIEHGLEFVVDAELVEAELEIENNTLIFNNGRWISGNFEYGIFKGGIFNGVFENGIFEDGEMRGKFLSGINKKDK